MKKEEMLPQHIHVH